eukprot:CAMPEP_0202809360 /NCGR_PEP_ID=MMETSP1389-20130828/1682_1 /ASSEMBLY_ACC=CAM_ASM_000865 /TAXON_ID=302021 /ORGANISM="Rhodomonas sp., Strain CCMP768" /LENGTH=50 /DNA_ID=CAMNT_0049479935 /DNA_START=166 /DNA_END=318 /DNA_ORIENTATION=-
MSVEVSAARVDLAARSSPPIQQALPLAPSYPVPAERQDMLAESSRLESAS